MSGTRLLRMDIPAFERWLKERGWTVPLEQFGDLFAWRLVDGDRQSIYIAPENHRSVRMTEFPPQPHNLVREFLRRPKPEQMQLGDGA
jgi:hypothetical protein